MASFEPHHSAARRAGHLDIKPGHQRDRQAVREPVRRASRTLRQTVTLWGSIRRDCARLRSPGPITLREARFADLQIPIADSVWAEDCAAVRRQIVQIIWLGVDGCPELPARDGPVHRAGGAAGSGGLS